jgi:hypothetical protein
MTSGPRCKSTRVRVGSSQRDHKQTFMETGGRAFTVLATFQMIGIVSLQLLYALFCLMLFPSNDKADSAMVTRQAQSLPSFASLLHLSAPSFACAPFRSTTRCLLSCAITLAV